MFYGITAAQTVTVKVPQGASGYGQSPGNTTDVNWGNGVRGPGWNGSGFIYGTVNATITVIIEYGQ